MAEEVAIPYDWGSLPKDLLLRVFTIVQDALLEEGRGGTRAPGSAATAPPARAAARLAATLAAVCRHWAAVAQLVPVSASLERDSPASGRELAWILGRRSVAVLVVSAVEVASLNALVDTSLADAVLSCPQLADAPAPAWGRSLTTLALRCSTSLPLGGVVVPRLARLAALSHLELAGALPAQHNIECDCSQLAALTGLRTLRLHFYRLTHTERLPPGLASLTLACQAVSVALPPGARLERLAVQSGSHLSFPFSQLPGARRISLQAPFVHLSAAAPPLPGRPTAQLLLDELAASHVQAFRVATNVLLASPGPGLPERPLRMSELRRVAGKRKPAGATAWVEYLPHFTTAKPSASGSELCVERRPTGTPSCWDLSAVELQGGDGGGAGALERALLESALASAISWSQRQSPGPVAALLGSPAFVARNAGALQEMRLLPLAPALDLRPYTRLTCLRLCRLEAPPTHPLPPAVRQLSLMAARGCRHLHPQLLASPGGNSSGGAAPLRHLESLVLSRGFVHASLPGGLHVDELRFSLDSRGTGSFGARCFMLGGGGGHSSTIATAGAAAGAGSAAAPVVVGRLVVDAAHVNVNRILLGGGAWLAGVHELEVCYADTSGAGRVVLALWEDDGEERGSGEGGGDESACKAACSTPSSAAPPGGCAVAALLAALATAAPDCRLLALRFSTPDLLLQNLFVQAASRHRREALAHLVLGERAGEARAAAAAAGWCLEGCEPEHGLIQFVRAEAP